MSLSTRIAIAPSRCLALVEAAMFAGAILITAASAAARLVVGPAPAALWFVLGATALAAIVFGARRWMKQAGSCVYEVFISARGGVSARYLGEDTMPHPLDLSDSTMVWPGFAVLSLKWASLPAHRTAGRHRELVIPIVRAEMNEGDSWRLHRFLLWALRNGGQAAGSTGKDFRG